MPTPADDDRETIAWPFWMLRFVATDDPDAFSDLIWSVGGSPPYGGVSYDEGAAVYELLESYRGAGEATPEAYDAVRAHIADNVERQDALEIFRLNDRIVSRPSALDGDAIARGSELATRIGHDGLRCLFRAYEAQRAHQSGEVGRARDLTIEALRIGLPVAATDNAYARRMAQLAQNAIALTAMAGDRAGALRLQAQLADLLNPNLQNEE